MVNWGVPSVVSEVGVKGRTWSSDPGVATQALTFDNGGQNRPANVLSE